MTVSTRSRLHGGQVEDAFLRALESWILHLAKAAAEFGNMASGQTLVASARFVFRPIITL
jgi:hypothetical protein